MANGISLNDPNEGTADVRISRVGDNIVLQPGSTGTGDVIPHSDNNVNLGDASHRWQTMYGVATSTHYADLAERYTVRGEVEPGDVILIAEDDDVDCEKSNEIASHRVLGVVSTNPGVRMNESLEGAPFIALRGRVPCKVQGPLRKGACLVSNDFGVASAINNTAVFDRDGVIFAKALESIEGEVIKVIEVVIL